MKKSLAIALLIFFISSCSVKPGEDSTISPAQISAFSSTINDEGLFFTKILPPIPPATDPTPTAVPFKIASDGTYVDGKGVIYTMTHFINDTTVMATSVDYGEQKHSLIDGVYGVVFQEIAYTPVSSDVTADFRAKVNNKKLDSEQSGSWQRFVIPENGIYKTDNITYTITRLVGADSALVAKNTGGSEVHTLLGDEYGVFAGSTVTKDIAFKKATTGEASPLITTLGGFVKSTPTSGAWVSLDAIDTTYKLDDVTYEIGKIIDPDTILVAKSPSGVETHKIIAGTSFGPVTTPGSSSIIEKAFKKATPGDVNPFAISIVGFVDSTKWDPFGITGTKYTANDISYDIGKVIDAISVLVASPSGVETHKLVDDNKSLTNFKASGRELAFKKATKPEITTFFGVKELAKFVYTTPVAGKWKLLDTTGTTNYKIGSDTYEIGKINSDNTILVKKAGTDAETHKLVDDNKSLTNFKASGAELAFKRDVPAIRAFITGKLTDFIDSTKWNPVDVDVDGTKYTVEGTTYDIGKIIGTTSVFVAKTGGGVETHALSAKTLKNGGTELAFKRATEADVRDFVDSTLKDFIHANDGKWNPVTATSGLASYTLSGVTYNVYKINGNTATVVIGTSTDPAGAARDHTLLDVTNYVLKRTTTPLAIRRNDTTDERAITTFVNKFNALELVRVGTTTPFSTINSDGTYTHDGETYEIGRVIKTSGADDDVLVAFEDIKTETYRLIEDAQYAILDTDSTMDDIIAELHTGDPVGTTEVFDTSLEIEFKINPVDNTLHLTSTGVGKIEYKKLSGSAWIDVSTFDAEVGKDRTVRESSLALHPTTGKPTIAYTADPLPRKLFVKKFDSSWTGLGGDLLPEKPLDSATKMTLVYGNDKKEYAAFTHMNDDKKLYIKKYTRGSWTSVYTSTEDTTENMSNIDLQSSGNNIYVSYGSFKKAYRIEKMNTATPGTWTKMTPSDGFNGEELSLAIHEDKPYAAYKKDDKIYVKKWTRGTSWEAVGPDGGFIDDYSHYVRLAISRDGIPYVLYKDKTTEKLSLKKYVDGAWVYVSKDFVEMSSDRLELAIDKDGTPYVAYATMLNVGPTYVRKFKKHTP